MNQIGHVFKQLNHNHPLPESSVNTHRANDTRGDDDNKTQKLETTTCRLKILCSNSNLIVKVCSAKDQLKYSGKNNTCKIEPIGWETLVQFFLNFQA